MGAELHHDDVFCKFGQVEIYLRVITSLFSWENN